MSTLTSLLSRDGVVSLDLIEQALQRQVLEGGELDTALLELGAVPENVLGAYRAASFELPAASRDQLRTIDATLLARVPARLAREHRIVPIAFEGETLTVATDAPLPLADVQRLARELGMRLQFRIATELRIEAALAAHYGLELTTRLRVLNERLSDREAGELRAVQAWSQKPPPAANSRSDGNARAAGAKNARSTGVRVAPVVTLGSSPRPIVKEASSEAGTENDTMPGRPSKMPPPPSRARRGHSARGPFTRKQAVEFLARAKDRDEVIDVFFAFARQYFECTVLFALRDERLLGLEAAGLHAIDNLRTLDIELPDGGSVRRVLSRRVPQIVDMRKSPRDRELVETLDRKNAQPSVLIPVAIRQRIVALLYGDRTGRPITLTELGDLTATLPTVAGAFERIIHERKLHAVEAQRRAGALRAIDGPAPEGTFRPSSAPPPSETRARSERPPSVAGVAFATDVVPREPRANAVPRPSFLGGPAASLLGMRGDAPPPPRLPSELDAAPSDRAPAAKAVDEPDVVDRPTVQLKADSIESALRSSPPTPRARKGVSYSRRDAGVEQLGQKRDDLTQPERPSRIPPERRGHSSRSEPPPRSLSQAPPGAGSYALHQKDAALASDAEQARDARLDANASEPAARTDPRRERGDEPPSDDVVSIPKEVADSLRTARAAGDAAAPLPPPARVPVAESALAAASPKENEAEALVEQLCLAPRDETRALIEALLQLGDTALPVLKRRFPGPLWFDRNKARQRMPAGRDVSAIARALFAFEARATKVIIELLSAPQAEIRLYATLLAADRCDRELLWPVYQRLFDSDAQVRWVAFENLPTFRGVPGFYELSKALRVKAGGDKEAIADRVAALDAINALRDAGSVELLLKLSLHQNRQLSVPAHRTLVTITAQDFGDSERKWKGWLDKNRERHRAEWLIESLMHADERVRNVAGMELQRLSHEYYGYVASAPKRDRERVQRKYREWWEERGRAQFVR